MILNTQHDATSTPDIATPAPNMLSHRLRKGRCGHTSPADSATTAPHTVA
jgi:hypothetical protein